MQGIVAQPPLLPPLSQLCFIVIEILAKYYSILLIKNYYYNNNIYLGTIVIKVATLYILQATIDLVLNFSLNLIIYRINLITFSYKFLQLVQKDINMNYILFLITKLIILRKLVKKLTIKKEPNNNKKEFFKKINLYS